MTIRTPLAMTAAFSCDRTCPAHEAKTDGLYLCRFDDLFRAIGATARVHSHTVTVKTDLKDPAALRRAVEALDWKWIGPGTHRLFQRDHITGNAFHPTGWNYPVVLGTDGQFHFDDFNGHWGNPADLERLKSEYQYCAVEAAAQALGYHCERAGAIVTVYNPHGGTLTLDTTTGNVETAGFLGKSCHEFREKLGLVPAGEIHQKQEAYAQEAEITQQMQ